MIKRRIEIGFFVMFVLCIFCVYPACEKHLRETGVVKRGRDWCLVEKGIVVSDYTGFADNANGTWYCRSGKVDFSANGVIKGDYGSQSKWGHVVGGKLQEGETVEENDYGWWYVGEDGFVDFSKNTISKNKLGWWMIQEGRVNFGYTGFADNANGTWYCRSGKVDFAANGIINGNYGGQSKWGYVVDGKLQQKESLEKNNHGWWYIDRNGFVDFSASTTVQNQYGTWRVQNGKVDLAYTGLWKSQNAYYQVSDGKVMGKIDGSSKIQIKPYFREEMQKTIDSVRALQTEPTLVFPLITDIHYMGSNQLPKSIQDSVVNIGYFVREIPSLGVVNLGDNTNGATGKYVTMERNAYLLQLFQGVGVPYYPCIGNHDDNRYRDLFRLEELQKVYYPSANSVVGDPGMAGTNYYKDFDEYKIRFIWLNANMDGKYGYSDHTVDWLENTALQTDEGYSICIFTHFDPIPSHNCGGQSCWNGSRVQSLIEQYEETTGTVVAVFSGHNHVDAAFDSSYLSIITNCQKFENENGDPQLWPEGAEKPKREIENYTEDCWDVVVIRPESRKINMIRFGAGEDREYTY